LARNYQIQVDKGDTLANVLRRDIADKILSRRIEPGTKLDERRLAEEYGVSRTPVREALKQLISTGLASSKPHAGTVVQLIDRQRLGTLCEASIELESLCARLAAVRITAVELGRLKKIHQACEHCHNADDSAGYALENRKFHSAVIRNTQNEDLADAVEHCRLKIAPFQRVPFKSKARRAASQQEHQKIIDALERHDPIEAAASMREHLTSAAIAIDEQLPDKNY